MCKSQNTCLTKSPILAILTARLKIGIINTLFARESLDRVARIDARSVCAWAVVLVRMDAEYSAVA